MALRIEDDNTVYVAVGKDVEESKPTLLWALKRFPGKKFIIIHVHQRFGLLPLTAGTKMGQLEHRVVREFEIQMLDDHLSVFHQAGVEAEKLYIEMDEIGDGIVKLVYQHNIKKLVMGAAANQHYSEIMMHLKSKKALYVRQRVPHSCQIWFTCNGQLIQTEGTSFPGVESLSLPSSASFGSGQSSQTKSPKLEAFLALPAPNLTTQTMVVAEKSSRDAYGESMRHGQTEQTSDIDTICRATALESLYMEELRSRMELEKELAKAKEKLRSTVNERSEELTRIRDEKVVMELQLASLFQVGKELRDCVLSAEEVSKAYKKERDQLITERNNEHSSRQAEHTSNLNTNRFTSYFSFLEILKATRDFDSSTKIEEGAHWTLYKGLLRQTPVTIKVQGPQEFEQEEWLQTCFQLDLMRKLRHPNIITLIGVCPEACVLIFEYLPNGSLSDRLNCKDNTTPLSWQTRVRIATDLCAVLIFLQSSNPDPICHGDLNPANILLDANFTCKVTNFGVCHTNSLHQNSRNMTQSAQETDSGDNNTLSCLDPDFLETGELSPKSDVYSFGVILMQLLIGTSSSLSDVLAVAAVVEEGNLSSLLDPLAGDWPFVQANQLAHLGMSCCSIDPNERRELDPEAWRVLEPIRSSFCGASPLVPLTPEEQSNPPSYFMCPILQEVMEKPRVAADGYTYEEEAIMGWIESGHDTSPMTNLELDHVNLVPNHALRSAIREWEQRRR